MDEIKITHEEYIAELESQLAGLQITIAKQNIYIRKLQQEGGGKSDPQS